MLDNFKFFAILSEELAPFQRTFSRWVLRDQLTATQAVRTMGRRAFLSRGIEIKFGPP